MNMRHITCFGLSGFVPTVVVARDYRKFIPWMLKVTRTLHPRVQPIKQIFTYRSKMASNPVDSPAGSHLDPGTGEMVSKSYVFVFVVEYFEKG